MAANSPPNSSGPLHPFTSAQDRVAELLADGYSAPMIGDALGCSYHTVCAHIRAMAQVLPGEQPAQERIRAFVLARRRVA